MVIAKIVLHDQLFEGQQFEIFIPLKRSEPAQNTPNHFYHLINQYQYLIYNALVYNKSLSVKTVDLLNSQERGYYFRLVIVKSASEEVCLKLCLKGRQTV